MRVENWNENLQQQQQITAYMSYRSLTPQFFARNSVGVCKDRHYTSLESLGYIFYYFIYQNVELHGRALGDNGKRYILRTV